MKRGKSWQGHLQGGGVCSIPQSRALLVQGSLQCLDLWLRSRIWLLAQTLSLTPLLPLAGWLTTLSLRCLICKRGGAGQLFQRHKFKAMLLM